jgi:hypothetical protein
VGLGESLDARFDLRASVPAGNYRVVCDAIVLASVDATITLIWRRGATDTKLAEWTQHFEPIGGGQYRAQPCEHEMQAQAIDFVDGDQLVFRYAGASEVNEMAWVPNGDGALLGGRIPHITLPQ